MRGNPDEDSIESLRMQIDLLQGEFLECLSSQSFERMSEINDKISSLENRLLNISDMNEIVSSQVTMSPQEFADTFKLTAAQQLIADLESASVNLQESVQSSFDEGTISRPQATEQVPKNGSTESVSTESQSNSEEGGFSQSLSEDQSAVGSRTTRMTSKGSLADSLGAKRYDAQAAALARESMFRAARRASERQNENAVVSKEAEQKLEDTLTVKEMVEHTTSFFDLFFNPHRFIAKHMEKSQPSIANEKESHKGGGAADATRDDLKSFAASPGGPKASDQALELRQKLESFCFYEIMSVSQTASAEEIGHTYIEKLKNLRERFQNKRDLQEWQFNELIRALTRANEVLSEPSLRRSYDLSLLGLHEFTKYPSTPVQQIASSASAAKGKLLSLAELFAVGDLISKDELELARKQNRDLSDKEFIEYALENHLADFDQISAVILAQSLISRDKLTLSQFKLAIKEMKQNSIRFIDTLVAEGWLTADELPTGR